jgi:hypothetical protein
LSRAEAKTERFVSVPRGVELLATGDADSHVVNDGRLTSSGLVAVAHNDLFNKKVIGRRSEVGIYERFLSHDREP